MKSIEVFIFAWLVQITFGSIVSAKAPLRPHPSATSSPTVLGPIDSLVQNRCQEALERRVVQKTQETFSSLPSESRPKEGPDPCVVSGGMRLEWPEIMGDKKSDNCRLAQMFSTWRCFEDVRSNPEYQKSCSRLIPPVHPFFDRPNPEVPGTVITTSSRPWPAPFPTRSPETKGQRICWDNRGITTVCENRPAPLPRVRDLFELCDNSAGRIVYERCINDGCFPGLKSDPEPRPTDSGATSH